MEVYAPVRVHQASCHGITIRGGFEEDLLDKWNQAHHKNEMVEKTSEHQKKSCVIILLERTRLK